VSGLADLLCILPVCPLKMASAARDYGLHLLVCFLGCVHFALAQTGYVYQLDTEYAGVNFFQGWNFYTVRISEHRGCPFGADLVPREVIRREAM
jgi:hypothetical protein